MRWLRCAMRGKGHNATRHPLGGRRCVDCGVAYADMREAGQLDDDRVAPMRRLFEREPYPAVTVRSGF